MSERICRTCGGTYRGLVCHKCHPRTKRTREPGPTPEEMRAAAGRAAFAPQTDAATQAEPMTDAAEAAHETD